MVNNFVAEKRNPILRASKLHLLFLLPHVFSLFSLLVTVLGYMWKSFSFRTLALLNAVGVVGILRRCQCVNRQCLEPCQQPAGLPGDFLMVTEGWCRYPLRSFAPQLIWETTNIWLNLGSPFSELTGKNVSLSFMRLKQWLNIRPPVRGLRGSASRNSKLDSLYSIKDAVDIMRGEIMKEDTCNI